MNNSSANSVRYAVYARIASDAANSSSITDQTNECTSWAAKANPNWVPAETAIYTDAGASGLSCQSRPGLSALLERTAQHPRPFDHVVMTEISRLARSIPEVLRITALLSYHGIALHFSSQCLNSNEPNFRLILSTLSLIDEGFIDRLAKKVRRGQHAKMANGYSVGGRCFGYSSVPVFSPDGAGLQGTKLTVSEPEAATIRRIYREFAAGASAAEIAKGLNAERVPLPRFNGARFHGWTSRSVLAVLRQARYRGTVVWGRTKVVRNPETGKIIRIQWHEREVVRVPAPELRIVDSDLASAVDQRLAAKDWKPESDI